MKETVDPQEFLKRLKEMFRISRIYYPGAGFPRDQFLEGPFKLEEIVYLEKKKDIPVHFRDKGYYVIGDFGKLPFRDGSFDALYYHDNHAKLPETDDMIKIVRLGGIIIHSNDCDENMDITKFEKIPGMKKLDLPFTNQYYTVFQRVQPF